MPNPSILIVEDDDVMRRSLSKLLKKEKYAVEEAVDGDAGFSKARDTAYDLIITDLKMPGKDGIELLRSVKAVHPQTLIIVITAYATIDTAIQAIKEGAEDYIPKPFNLDQIRLVIRRVLEKKNLLAENMYLRNELQGKYRFENIIGKSPAMLKVFEMIAKVADSKATVLITGETGTGKELVARAVHFNSSRSNGVFLPVDCVSLSENLLESELFGHVKGAFTGAIRNKKGIFEIADKGTIFLDEIGDISPSLQLKLLRVLDEGVIQPVGGTERASVDVRVITATNRNLETMVESGVFRQDLYFRLNVVSIELPALRERIEDIVLLSKHFLEKYCRESGREIPRISAEALLLLEAYHWPGNIREIENTIERAVLLEASEEISPESLPDKIARKGADQQVDQDSKIMQTLEGMARSHVMTVLDKTQGNRTKAADILGINRTTLWRMLKRLGIDG
ncbi:MAG: sigma-54 dependent transcriptional regulator [Pseudomonadota bacterium]